MNFPLPPPPHEVLRRALERKRDAPFRREWKPGKEDFPPLAGGEGGETLYPIHRETIDVTVTISLKSEEESIVIPTNDLMERLVRGTYIRTEKGEEPEKATREDINELMLMRPHKFLELCQDEFDEDFHSWRGEKKKVHKIQWVRDIGGKKVRWGPVFSRFNYEGIVVEQKVEVDEQTGIPDTDYLVEITDVQKEKEGGYEVGERVSAPTWELRIYIDDEWKKLEDIVVYEEELDEEYYEGPKTK